MAEHITILHLSDLHFAGTDQRDSKIVIDALIEDIELQRAANNIDLVIFSGDLVKAGGVKDLFDKVKAAFIERVIAAAQITENEFLICPGNHDIDRDVVTAESYVETGLLHELRTRPAINSFLDQHSKSEAPVEIAAPIQRLANFYEKVWNLKQPTSVAFSQFMVAHEFLIAGKRVGVCCFNSAWRTTGLPDDADYGHLIIGERTIDDGVKAIADCEIRIAVFHHPLSWLQDADQAISGGRLQSEFDLLVFGHTHRACPEQKRGLLGEVITSQGACLYYSRDWFNGYNIIRIWPDEETLEISIQEYSDARRAFIPATRLLENPVLKFRLPPRGDRARTLLADLLLRAKVGIRSLANKHLSLVGESGEQLNIEKHFECPELMRGSIRFSSEPLKGVPKEQVDALIRSEKSLVIVGNSESGKTSLAHYLAVQASIGAVDCTRLPLIGRFTDCRRGDHQLWRLLRNYANEISDNSITRATLERESVLAIIDDVDLFDDDRLDILTTLMKAHANVRWILLVKSPAAGISPQAIIDKRFPDVEVATIRGLTRSAVRALAASWMQLENDENRADTLYRSVMEQIQRTGLPRSGYVVSLILWAMKNKSSGELLNEAVLLQNIIDFMLGRMDYTGALRSELDFTTKSSILQHLAMHFKETKDVHDKNDVLQFIISLLNRKGLKYDAGGLLNSFIGCGLLAELGSEISFRYSRFQEFFVAGYLRDNPNELEVVKEEKYFDFARELDLFTARWRHESSFLDIGKKHLLSIEVGDPRLNGQLLEEFMAAGQRSDFTRAQLNRMRKEPMTAEKIDELLDRTDKRVAEKRALEIENKAKTGVDRSSLIIRYYIALELYSQFTRNLEFIDKEEKQTHLRECFLGWEKAARGVLTTLADSITEVLKELPDDKTNDEKIPKEQIVKLMGYIASFLKSIIPTAISDVAYRTLGSEKLVEFIGEIAHNENEPKMLKLLCGFVLLELAPATGLECLRRLSEAGPDWMRGAITQKLHMYYVTRPLSGNLKQRFEDLVADLQLQLEGGKKAQRGPLLARLKRESFLLGRRIGEAQAAGFSSCDLARPKGRLPIVARRTIGPAIGTAALTDSMTRTPSSGEDQGFRFPTHPFAFVSVQRGRLAILVG